MKAKSLSPLIILPLIVKKEWDGPVCLAYLGFGECGGHSAPCHDYKAQAFQSVQLPMKTSWIPYAWWSESAVVSSTLLLLVKKLQENAMYSGMM